MNAEVFSEWLRRQGHHVFRTTSSYWYNAGPQVLQAFPYHWVIRPEKKELQELTWRRNNLAVRYSTPLNEQDGMVSYHVVLCKPYDLDMLRSQARNGVKKGLQHFSVEQISCERMAKEGWLLQQDTLERQGRLESMNQSEWERICMSAEGLPGFEMWAAIKDGELAATLLTARIDDTCYVPYAQSHRKFLNLHANNALFYNYSQNVLAREGVGCIFFSLHSLDAPESVNEFKFRMGLIAKPVKQKIVFHPLIKPFANQVVYNALHKWTIRDPENCFIAKVEGIMKFYLQGKLPLEKQDTPTCLSEYKASILGTPLEESAKQESHVRIQVEA